MASGSCNQVRSSRWCCSSGVASTQPTPGPIDFFRLLRNHVGSVIMTWTASRPEVVLPAHEKGEVAIRPEFELPGDRWQKWLLASLGFGVMAPLARWI